MPLMTNPCFIPSTFPIFVSLRSSNRCGAFAMQWEAWQSMPIGKESESNQIMAVTSSTALASAEYVDAALDGSPLKK